MLRPNRTPFPFQAICTNPGALGFWNTPFVITLCPPRRPPSRNFLYNINITPTGHWPGLSSILTTLMYRSSWEAGKMKSSWCSRRSCLRPHPWCLAKLQIGQLSTNHHLQHLINPPPPFFVYIFQIYGRQTSTALPPRLASAPIFLHIHSSLQPESGIIPYSAH